MNQYLLSLHTVEGEAPPVMSDDEMQAMMSRIGALEEEMRAADALVYSGRLADAGAAKVITVRGGKTLTTDGPFTETKEQLGGFYIINAADIGEAAAWAAKTSECVGRPIEVRPFFGLR